jgi:hypothetical protein
MTDDARRFIQSLRRRVVYLCWVARKVRRKRIVPAFDLDILEEQASGLLSLIKNYRQQGGR